MTKQLHFNKYQGTGNDFIIIDGRGIIPQLDADQIALMCDRRFGIGADGLIVVCSSEKADFRMIYFNADGKESSMCGNGGRCAASFAFSHGIAGREMVVEGVDGLHAAFVKDDGLVRLRMIDVFHAEKIDEWYVLNTGSPHVVIPVDDVERVDVFHRGREIRYSDRFLPDGTNVNFIQFEKGLLHVRTYERGVEGETLSCGTGVTASVLACHLGRRISSDQHSVDVNTPGGKLNVSFVPKSEVDGRIHFTDIWLSGPAVHVFEGDITLP